MQPRAKSFVDELELAFKEALLVRNRRVFRSSLRRLATISDVG